MYEVATLDHCARMIGGGINNPLGGLLSTRSTWTRITPRPLGLARAKALADAQPFRAVVCVWHTAEKVHDNGKPARIPAGTWRPDARSAMEPKVTADTGVRS